MGYIAGWIGADGSRLSAEETASAMNGAAAAECHTSSILLEDKPITLAGSADSTIFRDGSLTLVVDGEPRWMERRDPSAVLGAFAARYRQIGTKALSDLHGHFAVVIHDAGNNRTILAVDRMGVRQLAYGRAKGGGIVFGTTASAVAAHPDVDARICEQSIYDYLYFHVVPGPATIYKGVHRLEAATFLVYENGILESDRYWTPDYRNTAQSLSDLEEELRQILRVAVDRCSADNATGVFLSGGIDSSTVAGLAQQGARDRRISAYTIGFEAAGYDEFGFARQAADHFGLDLHTYYVTSKDVATAIPTIARAYDQPFGNSSAVGVFFCSKLAATDGKRLLLAGDGGDELFAGNARYAKQKLFDLYRHVPSAIRENVLAPFAASTRVPNLLALQKLQSYVRQASLPMPLRMESYNILTSQSSEDVLDPAFLDVIDVAHPLNLLTSTYELPSSDNLLHRMLFLDWKFTLADNDLRKVTRMCEINDVQVRFPLLDEDLVNLSLKVPPRWLVKNQKLRFFFKDALRAFLPIPTLTKTKHGFGVPFGVWLTESRELQEAVYPLLESLKKRRVVKPQFIEKLLRGHRDIHQGYYGSAIWPLIALEQWFQTRSMDVRF